MVAAVLLSVSTAAELHATNSSMLAATAHRLALWLNASAVCETHGTACHWKMNSTDAAPHTHGYLADSLYYGTPGTAIFLNQLSAASSPPTKSAAWRSLAASALETARSSVNATLAAYGHNAGFYYGTAGIAFGLRTTGSSLPHAARYSAAAAELEEHLLTRVEPFAPPSNETVLWNNTDIAHGAAGTGLYLLWLSRQLSLDEASQSRAFDAAVRAALWLLTRAEPTADGGLRWARGPDTDGSHTNQYFPTFCCGGSGVSFFLAQLSQAPRLQSPATRSKLLGAALRGAKHILSLAKLVPPPSSDGPSIGRDGVGSGPLLLVPHEEEGAGLSVYYLGWCGGPPGWARLFVALHQATADSAWLEHLAAAARAVATLVQPATLPMLYPVPHGSPPWANLGQCCGASAAGQFLLSLGTSGMPLDADLKRDLVNAGLGVARAVAARGVSAAPNGGGLAMPSPEEHANPLDTRWQAGWMQGAAGVGSFLLDAAAVASGHGAKGRRVPWPDEADWS